MKTFAAATLLATLVAVPAMAQPAATPMRMTGVGPVCLHPFDSPRGEILRTRVLDPQHVVFYMRNGNVWLNTLKEPCRALTFRGFSFVTGQNDVCANSTPIKVVESGQICTLGPFTPFTPNAPAQPAQNP